MGMFILPWVCLFSQRVGRPPWRSTTKYAKLLQYVLAYCYRPGVRFSAKEPSIHGYVYNTVGMFIFTASRAPPVAPDYKVC